MNKEIVEWCGLDAGQLPCPIIECEEVRSHNRCKDCHAIFPDLEYSLDALFKWAVPKLQAYTLTESLNSGHLASVELSGKWSTVSFAETPALALCKAIMEVIK